MRFRVLTWNVMHGRAQPSAGRDLRSEFTAALAGWEWDVALLQEVPPWWPARLGAELEAEYRFRTLRLARFPERRWAHAAWLAAGFWVVNVHASGDEVHARRDGDLVARSALEWAAGAPLVVGGDFNLREPHFAGLHHAGERDVDHVFLANGVELVGPAEVLERGTLSDHPPLVLNVERPS
jgi:endonuclease/exonuclease/phosphatase family metal-dependent hydrolase